MEQNLIVGKNFPVEEYCPVQIFENNKVVIDTFNENENYQSENSRIKQNQILISERLGCLIFFNSNKIYFIDNEKMSNLLEKNCIKNENEDEIYYSIKKDQFFLLNFTFPIINVYLNENEKNLFVFQNDETMKKGIIDIFNISDLIENKALRENKVLDSQILNAQILINDEFLMLNKNNDLLLYDNNFNEKKMLSTNIQNFNYNKKNNSIIYNSQESIFLEKNNLISQFSLNTIININEEIIFLENINNLIIIYTKNDKEKPDKLYIIVLNENNEISGIYFDDDIFYPDKDENNGISINSKEKRAILSLFDFHKDIY